MSLLTVRWLTLGAAVTLVACADDLKTSDNGDKDAASSQTVVSSDKGDGVHETTVDATSETDYRYFDLDKNSEVKEDSKDWDLGFLRFKIKSNGGDSGDGDVLVARVEGQSFDDLSQAPTSSYVLDSDEVSSESEGGDPNFGFLGAKPWYSYESSNHQLTPMETVYVVRSTDKQFYKIQIESYYDKAGTPGFMKFQWAKIDKPSGDIVIMQQTTGPSNPGGDSGNEQKDAGSGDTNANPAAFGCYDLKAHVCDCKTDQSSCEGKMGTWTAQCSCDTK